MKRSASLFLIVLLLVFADTHAAGPPPPLEAHLRDNFVGDWKVERKMGNGRIAQTSVHCEWVLTHQLIRSHYGSAAAKPDSEANVFIGLCAAAKNYVCQRVD